ncbi:acyl-CoA dehydrogenase [Myxococcaceae bacterium]|nr:acyl-CoA dehydrogenase [Myxococcaceae bacterium]
MLREIEPSLDGMGELAAGPLHELSIRHRLDEPVHVPFDAWGNRIDEIRVGESWREYARVAAREGLVATGYERRHGPYSRLHQFALAYLFDRSSQVYTCPLAMTDGCARTLEVLAPPELREKILPRLLSRDPDHAWTSGQWMTEQIGGSDVGLSEAVAREVDGRFRLYGTKWFTSSVTSEVALTLARPDGNGPGGKGLALFFVEVRDARGRLQGITIQRLKEKLGTRILPTAELVLDGTPAVPLGGLSNGVRNISTMLNLTRTWNAIVSAAHLRRGLALARDYSHRRVAFGAALAEKPLHLDTLADLAAEHEAALQLAFHSVALLGREETDGLDDSGRAVLRLLQPVAKLTTGKAAVAGVSEALEAFGGAGYLEDTGIAELLRDAQVLPIWEGTTNVLALEAARAIRRTDALEPYLAEISAHAGLARHASLAAPARAAREAALHAREFWDGAVKMGPVLHEAELRRFALTLGRSLALALLVAQAQWAIDSDGDARSAAAARRFAARGVDLIRDTNEEPRATAALALDDELSPFGG